MYIFAQRKSHKHTEQQGKFMIWNPTNLVFWIVITFFLALIFGIKVYLFLNYSEKLWKVRQKLVDFLKYILSGFHILSWPQSSIIQPNKCKSASHDDEVGIFFIEDILTSTQWSKIEKFKHDSKLILHFLNVSWLIDNQV